jgi:hypothetical protein
MYTSIRYELRDAQTNEVIDRDVLATPRLLSEGVGEAYAMTERTSKGQAIWRARDDAYDARFGPIEYRRVRIVRVEDVL